MVGRGETPPHLVGAGRLGVVRVGTVAPNGREPSRHHGGPPAKGVVAGPGVVHATPGPLPPVGVAAARVMGRAALGLADGVDVAVDAVVGAPPRRYE